MKKVEVHFVGDGEVKKIFQALEPGKLKERVARRKKKASNSDDEDDHVPVQDKPLNLFERGDVAGEQLFGFLTPNRRKTLGLKAVTPSASLLKTPVRKHVTDESQSSPKLNKSASKSKTCKTPKRSAPLSDSASKISNCRTPYNFRKRLKSNLTAVKNLLSDDSGNEDFSASESEYDESNVSSDSSSDSEEDAEKSPVRPVHVVKESGIAPTRRRNLKLNFVPAAEEYFQSHASKKILTSNHTLGKLRHQLPQEKLFKLLSKLKISHEDQIKKLQRDTQCLFKKWHFLLSEGFNILLYGVGSKRDLLMSFIKEINEPCIVVNGFFPSLSIQEVISSIVDDLLKINISTIENLETVDYIKDTFSRHQNSRLFLVVHNIDGIMLRNDKSQEILSLLSSAPNIHLIASIDHINSALMWDQNMLSLFNFSWWDATTFEPYVNETAFESSLLIQQSGQLAFSALQNVFRSLTNNAKSIFLLIADYQKENRKDSHYNGMPFKHLYRLCRESLLVSSDSALRSQLTEFLDHKMVKSHRGTDGSELLTIPIEATILDEFVKQQKNL